MILPGRMGRPAYRLYQLAWAGLDWLYPPHCGGCGKPGSRWCTSCQGSVCLIPDTICRVCGKILDNAGLCQGCDESPPPYHALRAWAVYGGPLRAALLRLKYDRDIALGEILAHPLGDFLRGFNWQVDLVTAVPSGSAQRAQRGYNQAALLAFPLALTSGKIYRPQALVKSRETRSQVGLSFAQRHENVVGAFSANARVIDGNRILVVDDITTSGATVNACAKALRDAGARRVYCLALTRTTETQSQFTLSGG